MWNKKFFLILLIVAVIFLILGFYFWGQHFKSPTETQTNKQVNRINSSEKELPSNGQFNNNITAKHTNNKHIITKNNLSQEKQDLLEAQERANFFIEMLGTYSSDGNFKNIIDLQPMMTSKMLAWSKDFINRNSHNRPSLYQAVVTKVFSSQIIDNNNQQLTILVKTRRQEKIGEKEKNYNQTAKLVLKRNNSNWLVDSVDWQ